jgi:hypothetical protein
VTGTTVEFCPTKYQRYAKVKERLRAAHG